MEWKLKVLTLILFSFFQCQLLANEKLKIVRGNGNYFPKEYIEDGKLKGIHIDILDAVAKKLNVELEFESLPWNRALFAVENGQADALSYVSKTKDREAYLLFLTGNVLSSSHTYPIVLAENKSKITFDGDIDSLKKLVVAVGAGYQYGEPFDSAKELSRYTLTSPSQTQLTDLLLRKRVDIIIGSRRNLRQVYSEQEIETNFHIFNHPIATDHSYLGFSKKSANVTIADAFAEAIIEFKSSDRYKTLIRKYERLQSTR